MEALRIDKLSKYFGGLHVLRDLSLTIETGEYVAIIGPNGAGKTTLLNVIIGELPATSGRVYLLGKDVTAMPEHQRVKAGLGRSFQITRLFRDLSVIDNMALALQAVSPSRYQMLRQAESYREVFAEAERLLKTIDLWDKKDELASSISYGEQRKLEVTLPLALKPKVLLMDEPTTGLAPDEIGSFISTIKTLTAGTTLVFSAHDMDVVFDLADRIVVLYFGQIVAEGTPEEIQANREVREIYLGTEEGTPNA
jgi:branched-chain amino acid transport system ATP-binding protein